MTENTHFFKFEQASLSRSWNHLNEIFHDFQETCIVLKKNNHVVLKKCKIFSEKVRRGLNKQTLSSYLVAVIFILRSCLILTKLQGFCTENRFKLHMII